MSSFRGSLQYRRPTASYIELKKHLFERTTNLVYRAIFDGKINTKIGVSVFEALLVGVSLNIDYLERQPPSVLKEFFAKMLGSEEFSEQKLSEGLAGKTRVIERIKSAKRIFAGR